MPSQLEEIRDQQRQTWDKFAAGCGDDTRDGNDRLAKSVILPVINRMTGIEGSAEEDWRSAKVPTESSVTPRPLAMPRRGK